MFGLIDLNSYCFFVFNKDRCALVRQVQLCAALVAETNAMTSESASNMGAAVICRELQETRMGQEVTKPAASRKESVESYVLATGFHGQGGWDVDSADEDADDQQSPTGENGGYSPI